MVSILQPTETTPVVSETNIQTIHMTARYSQVRLVLVTVMPGWHLPKTTGGDRLNTNTLFSQF